MTVYHELFSSWADVQREYRMEDPEPDEVIYAYYTYEDYSGSSFVAYRKGDKYYTNSGSHCSCYGLEDQWEPEEYESKQMMLDVLSKMRWRNQGEEHLYQQLMKGESKGT